MPLPFEQFQGKGVLDFSPLCSDSLTPDKIWAISDKIGEDFFQAVANNGCFGFPEPTSVLDALTSTSPLASSSTTTLSSHGGAAATADEKCGHVGLEDLDGALSASPPGHEQSILRLIMGDVGSGFGAPDPGIGFGPGSVMDGLNPLFSLFHEQPFEEKVLMTNPDALITQSPQLFSPASNPPSSPPAKRFNSGQIGSHPGFHPQNQRAFPFPVLDPDPGHDPFRQTQKVVGDGQSAVIDQLFNAVELVGTGGDPVLAQGILARLNHHLTNNNINKTPFVRAALYITEALNSLIHPDSLISPSQNLAMRIAAYRAFSETSPFLHFVNFTANQAILESLEGFDGIHIIDFDLGYGTQWASLMQELVGRNRNRASPQVKLTAFASPLTITDEFELRFAEESLRNFAGEVKIPFEIEFLSHDLLLNPVHWPLSLRSSEKEAIAVNLPVSSVISGYLPLILRFLRQISPNVVVCTDRVCDRNDAPFPNAVIHALQYLTSLLESLDAANPSPDLVVSIERFCLQPSIQRLLTNRHRWIERSPAWTSLLGQCGFTAVRVSHVAEAQAECLVQRSCVRGFHVEKRQSSPSSLVLCWQRKELVSVSAWRCC